VNPYRNNFDRFDIRDDPGKALYRVLRITCTADRSACLSFLEKKNSPAGDEVGAYLNEEIQWVMFNDTPEKIPTAFADLVIVVNPVWSFLRNFEWRRIFNSNARLALVLNDTASQQAAADDFFLNYGFREESEHTLNPTEIIRIYRVQQIACCGRIS
jgi:hypothetical protein